MQLQLGCELRRRPGEPIAPNVMTQPPQQQQAEKQEEAGGKPGASRPLLNRNDELLNQRQSLHSMASAAGCGAPHFF